MNWTRLIAKLTPTWKTSWPMNCFHSYMSSLRAYLAQLSSAQEKMLQYHIHAWSNFFSVLFFFSPPQLSIPTPTHIWTAFHWFPFTLCKYCLLLCSSWQEFSLSQCSHLESILRRRGTESNEIRIGLFLLHSSAADPTLPKLSWLLIPEGVIASVMTTEVQSEQVAQCHKMSWGKCLHGENSYGKSYMFTLIEVTCTLLCLRVSQNHQG